MLGRMSAVACAAAVAGMLLAPTGSNARGGAGAAGHAGGLRPPVRPMHQVHPPFVNQHRPESVHREFRERHASHATERWRHRGIFWPGGYGYGGYGYGGYGDYGYGNYGYGDYGYGYPLTYGNDSAFYGTYYDPSDLARTIVVPVYAPPPAPVGPTVERLDPPRDRGACRSQTVAVASPGGAEHNVVITRC